MFEDSNGEPKVTVNFIGDLTHADLLLSKIDKFDAKFEEYSKTKKKNLILSIEIANKINKGEISYESHLISLKKRFKAKTMKKSNVK